MAGEKETFTASVTYNTEDLYGKVEASWKITVEPGKAATPGGAEALFRVLQGKPPAKTAKAPAKEAEKVPDKKSVD
jgi:hypothetical protein